MNDIIVADSPKLPIFQISPTALQERDNALSDAALIGRVENAEQNNTAVSVQKNLKRVAQSFEKARKTLKEPIIEAGRQLDRVVQKELLDIEKELGRIETLVVGFQLKEQRRIREEEEAQRRELARIEAEKLAELKRIAAEQAAAEAKARETTDAEQRAKLEAQAQAQAKAAAELAAQRAAEATAAEAKPITATRAAGQVIKTDWEITVTNPYELAKFHPDCVKIEPLLSPIKAALNAGIAVKGVKAEKVTKGGVRLGAIQLIDV